MSKEDKVHVDACGQEVVLGDYVAFVRPYSNNIHEGKIIKFTPKGITIEYDNERKSNRAIAQVIKLPPELRLERLLEN